VVGGLHEDAAAGGHLLNNKRLVVRVREGPHASHSPLVDIPSLYSAFPAVFTAISSSVRVRPAVRLKCHRNGGKEVQKLIPYVGNRFCIYTEACGHGWCEFCRK